MIEKRKPTWRLIAAFAAAVLLASACAGDDDSTTHDDGSSSGATAEATAVGPTARPATATPVPDRLEVTGLTCTEPNRFTINASGRVRNATNEPLDGLRAQIVLINQQRRATIPYLVRGPYTGISYDIRFDAEAMAVVETPNEPDWIAKSTVPVTPATLAPGAEATFEFPSLFTDPSMGVGQCAVVFIRCAPACEEIGAANNKVNVE